MSSSILIVGAGPVGLTLANFLTRNGIPVRIIDKAPHAAKESRALAVHARTLEMLDGMGLADRFIEQGVKIHAVNFRGVERELLRLSFDELPTPFPFILSIPQSQTEALLAEDLASRGVQVERQIEFVGLTPGASDLHVALRHIDGRLEESFVPWLIGCDGARSSVRKELGLTFEGSQRSEDWAVADLRLKGELPANEFHVVWHPAGLFALFQLPGGLWRIVANLLPGERVAPAGPSAPPDLDECRQIVRDRGPAGVEVLEAVWTSTFRIHERGVDRLRVGRSFVAGDAAHIHSPAGGQGMNTGMQDAENLAWKLALVYRGDAPDSLLDTYAAERLPVQHAVIRAASRLTKLAAMHGTVSTHIRDLLVPLLTGFDAVRRQLLDAASELNVQYRNSPIVENHHAGPGPAAGDHAPDAALLGPGGAPTRLWRELEATIHSLIAWPAVGTQQEDIPSLARRCFFVERQWAALVKTIFVMPGGPAAGPGFPGQMTLIDNQGAFSNAYGDKSQLVLVRPDGYVAFRGPATDTEKLRQYLERAFPRGDNDPLKKVTNYAERARIQSLSGPRPPKVPIPSPFLDPPDNSYQRTAIPSDNVGKIPVEIDGSNWLAVPGGLTRSRARSLLESRWKNVSGQLAGLRDRLLSSKPASVIRGPGSTMLELVRTPSNDVPAEYEVHYVIPDPVNAGAIRGALAAKGVEPDPLLMEFIAAFDGLHDQRIPNSGSFVPHDRWAMIDKSDWRGETVSSAANEGWKDDYVIYQALNGDELLYSRDGHIGWFVAPESKYKPYWGSFADFLEFYTEFQDRFEPLDSYATGEVLGK
jgi:2-polyprenyl-6-methoxyphenol hydroxylase-like FAD-dependent oxidoreductase